jgi:hypothetical protein
MREQVDMKQVAMDLNWCVRRASREGMARYTGRGRRNYMGSGRHSRMGHGIGGGHLTARGRRNRIERGG